jgi:ADP-ribose pyrophosphatase YjhB (NUDIX family)
MELDKNKESFDIDYQKRILLFLMHDPYLSFNRLWNKEGRSNKFAYHLKVLIEKGLVEKNDKGEYCLTTKGKRKVAYIESTGKRFDNQIVAVVVLISKGSRYLMLHRKKEPFYGYWGIHGGRLRSENYILEQAKESVKKETGLECEFELKGLFSSKSYVGDDFAYGHQLFVVKGRNPKGELLRETSKGVNRWVEKKDLKKLKILPNIPVLIKIANGKKFRWVEADRFQKGKRLSMSIGKEVLF